MSIVVCGYYNKNNFGDELYKDSMRLFFKDFDLVFCGPDDIICANSDAIVFGGGDVINDYFHERWTKNIKRSSTLKIALSVGLPFPKSVHSGYLDNMDHVFLRNTTDLGLVQSRIGSEFTHYLPDLAFMLDYNRTRYRKRNIGIFPIPMTEDEFRDLFKIISVLLKSKYHVTVFRFDTSGTEIDDSSVLNRFGKFRDKRFKLDYTHYSTEKMLEKMAKLSGAICYRFHSHILCTILGVPFVSMSNTRKVNLYLQENGLTELANRTDLFDILNSKEISNRLLKIAEYNRELLKTDQVNNIIRFRRERNLEKGVSVDQLHEDTLKMMKSIDTSDMNTSKAELIAQFISLGLTKIPDSKYVYGTIENILKGINIFDIIKWIAEDFEPRKIFSSKNGLFNVEYIKQVGDEEIHRSGWNYVVNNMLKFNNPYGILLDTYLDRTFHWCEDSLRLQGIIPYTGLWMGFVHHTDLEWYSEYNINRMFKKRSFQQSLKTCKGIFVLSNYLNEKLTNKFREIGMDIPVYTLYHPTEFPDKTFCYDNFRGNLVQIGAWLRDPLGIFKIETCLNKYSLKGKNMENYFPPKEIYFTSKKPKDKFYVNMLCRDKCSMFIQCLKEYLVENKYFSTETPAELYLTDSKESIIHTDLSKRVNDLINSVKIIEKVDNNEYDRILSESAVFIRLFDCSAVNTVIECIVRNTPIIVNRHPALVEILGDKYPLFYTSLSEVDNLTKYLSILRGHEYLKKLDKSQLRIDNFITTLLNHIENWS